MANDLFSKILKLRLSSKNEATNHCPDLTKTNTDYIEPTMEECVEVLRPSKSRRKQVSTWNHRNIKKLFSRKNGKKLDHSFDSNIDTINRKSSWSDKLNTISLGSKTPAPSPLIYPKKTFMHFFGRKRNPLKASQPESSLCLDESITDTPRLISKSENEPLNSFENPDRVSDSGKGTGSEGDLVPPFSLQKYRLSNEMECEENESRESPSAKIMKLEFLNGFATGPSAAFSTPPKSAKEVIRIPISITSTQSTNTAVNNAALAVDKGGLSSDLLPSLKSPNGNAQSTNAAAYSPFKNTMSLYYNASPSNSVFSSLSATPIKISGTNISTLAEAQTIPFSNAVASGFAEDLASSRRLFITEKNVRPTTLEVSNSPGNSASNNATLMSTDSDDLILDFSLGGEETPLEELKIGDCSPCQISEEKVFSGDDVKGDQSITMSLATYNGLLSEIGQLKNQICKLIVILSAEQMESN